MRVILSEGKNPSFSRQSPCELDRALILRFDEIGPKNLSLRHRQLTTRQPVIANLERRADMYLSTLPSVIEGMGGELDVRAVFPDGSVRIKRLKELRKREPRRA